MHTTRRPGPPFIPGLLEDDGIGLCPKCKRCSGGLDHGSHHYGICIEHQLAWIWGDYFGEGGLDEGAEYEANAAILHSFTIADPYHHGSDGASLTLPVYESELGPLPF